MKDVNVEKFIEDLKARINPNFLIPVVNWALSEQGFEYKDCEIQAINEPKFNEGDWVTDGINNYLIQGKAEKAYVTETIDGEVGCILFDNVNRFHLWSIEDAKDGDILCDDNAIILFRKIGNECWDDVIDYHLYLDKKGVVHLQKGVEFWGTTCTELKPAVKDKREALKKALIKSGYTYCQIIAKEWEPKNGDRVRLKKDDGRRWQISLDKDDDGLDKWLLCEEVENGIAGGWVSTWYLKEEYEFIDNPMEDAKKAVEKEFQKLRWTIQ